MVKVFLDTNILINLVEKRGNYQQKLDQQNVFISPLSAHILFYVTKRTVPNEGIIGVLDYFTIIPFDNEIFQNALLGPTKDFEDNVQLHSASTSDCDMFLTEDKKLLQMKFFGKTHIHSSIS